MYKKKPRFGEVLNTSSFYGLSFEPQRTAATFPACPVKGVLNVIDAGSIARIGNGTDKLAIDFAGGYFISS